MMDDQHTAQNNHTTQDQLAAAALLLPSTQPNDQHPSTANRPPTTNTTPGLPQPFPSHPPHPTPHPALVAATPSTAPSSSSPSSVASRVNTFRSACLDCLISHQTHHLIPHSSKVVIFDSKLKVAHAFDGLVTHDINCFPSSDTRILTDKGFAYLNEIEDRISGGESVLYGCYDRLSEGLVYRRGELVFDTRSHKQLVSIASPGEVRRWMADSDEYGRRGGVRDEEVDDVDAGVSLRVTPQHLLYSQHGRLDSTNGSTFECDSQPPTLRQAESLLSPCSCPSDMSQCTHRAAATRLVALARTGYVPTPIESEGVSCSNSELRQAADVSDEMQSQKGDLSDKSLAVKALQLTSAESRSAFFGLLGYWLWDGSLEYDETGRPICLRLGQREESDHTWLQQQLRGIRLIEHSQPLPHAHTKSHTEADSLCITDERWLRWFHGQFGAQPTVYHPSTLTSRYSTTDTSSHSPLSLTATSRSAPASPSSSSSSPSFYSSDDDFYSHPPLRHSQTSAGCRLPDWLMLQLTGDEVRLVISGMWRASGSWESGDKRITTSSVQRRDQLMQALLHCGYSPCCKLVRSANSLRIDTPSHVHSLSGAESIKRGSLVCWAVTWTDLSSPAAQRSSMPTLARQRDVSLVDYDEARDGRLWCVNVQHPDHLVVAQRAHRNKDGVVTKQSRPIVVGNCAPVWDSTRRKYVGLLSVSDFLDILLATANEADRTLFLSLSQQRLCDWAEFKRRRGTSISRLLCISPESTLHEAVRQLLNYRVHRLCVVQLALADTILRILTNHGILRFLRQACPQMATVSIRDLGIGVFENLLTLTYQTPISRAMEMLSMYRVSSIPVVDAHGRPVDVYSRSDIRYLAMDNAWTNLDISIEQALQPHQHGRTLPLCTRDDTLQTVAGLLIACNKHSLICVHPTTGLVEGVVSLTDIFSFILNTGPPQAESRVAALRADLERERVVVEDAQAVATAAGAGQLSEEELIRRGLASPLEAVVGGRMTGEDVGGARGGRKGGSPVEDSEMGEANTANG